MVSKSSLALFVFLTFGLAQVGNADTSAEYLEYRCGTKASDRFDPVNVVLRVSRSPGQAVARIDGWMARRDFQKSPTEKGFGYYVFVNPAAAVKTYRIKSFVVTAPLMKGDRQGVVHFFQEIRGLEILRLPCELQ